MTNFLMSNNLPTSKTKDITFNLRDLVSQG